MKNRLEFRAWDKGCKDRKAAMLRVVGLGDSIEGILCDSLEKINKNTVVGNVPIYRISLIDPPIMQSTGIKDKNGKLIFEGDICHHSRGTSIMKDICVVEWVKDAYSAGFLLTDLERSCTSFDPRYIEIIGNKFENPDLLKKEDK